MIDNAGTTRLMDPYGKVPKVVNLEVLASKVNDEYSYVVYTAKFLKERDKLA